MRKREGLRFAPSHRAPAGPRSDVFQAPPPSRQLPVHTVAVSGELHPSWFFVTACGGSGASLLARMSARSYQLARTGTDPALAGGPLLRMPAWGLNAGRAWPNPVLEPTGQVVIVTRTTMAGLAAAQDAAAQYLAGRAPAGTELLGLVAVSDRPGRLPRLLASSLALLAGVYPAVWHLPYVPEYRLLPNRPGDECPTPHPAIEHVLDEIQLAATRGISA